MCDCVGLFSPDLFSRTRNCALFKSQCGRDRAFCDARRQSGAVKKSKLLSITTQSGTARDSHYPYRHPLVIVNTFLPLSSLLSSHALPPLRLHSLTSYPRSDTRSRSSLRQGFWPGAPLFLPLPFRPACDRGVRSAMRKVTPISSLASHRLVLDEHDGRPPSGTASSTGADGSKRPRLRYIGAPSPDPGSALPATGGTPGSPGGTSSSRSVPCDPVTAL